MFPKRNIEFLSCIINFGLPRSNPRVEGVKTFFRTTEACEKSIWTHKILGDDCLDRDEVDTMRLVKSSKTMFLNLECIELPIWVKVVVGIQIRIYPPALNMDKSMKQQY